MAQASVDGDRRPCRRRVGAEPRGRPAPVDVGSTGADSDEACGSRATTAWRRVLRAARGARARRAGVGTGAATSSEPLRLVPLRPREVEAVVARGSDHRVDHRPGRPVPASAADARHRRRWLPGDHTGQHVRRPCGDPDPGLRTERQACPRARHAARLRRQRGASWRVFAPRGGVSSPRCASGGRSRRPASSAASSQRCGPPYTPTRSEAEDAVLELARHHGLPDPERQVPVVADEEWLASARSTSPWRRHARRGDRPALARRPLTGQRGRSSADRRLTERAHRRRYRYRPDRSPSQAPSPANWRRSGPAVGRKLDARTG